MLQHLITNRRVEGQPIQSGEMTLTPVSKALVLELPGRLGGFTWNRPAGVRVTVPGREDQFVPVRDVTRRTIGAILGSMLGAMLLVWIMRRR